MDAQEMISGARDAVSVKRVYGDPYEKNGLTVIPAATVRGGGGGGSGENQGGDTGGGGGFGLAARPAGAWIIEGDQVNWKPAVDVNRVVLGAQAIALTAIVVTGRILLAHSRRRNRLLDLVSLVPLTARLRRRAPDRERRALHLPGIAR
jgi:uncharacterized spore protein YtfJ